MEYGPVDVVCAGVIGCGGIAFNQHIPAIQTEVPALEVGAVCDVDPNRLQSALETFGIPWGTRDYRELLDRPDIDAVLIATGTDTLVDIACEALARGKHVFVEKPLAGSVQEALRLAPLMRGRTSKFQVGFNRRFSYGYRLAKRMIDDGLIGEPSAIDLRFWFSPPSDPSFIVEDLLLNVGIHTFDICQYFMGAARTREVSARLRLHDREGSLSVLLEFENGAIGSILLSSAGTWLYPDERVEVVGTKEIVLVDNVRRVSVLERDGSMKSFEPSYSTHWLSGRELSGFAPQLRHFAECILLDREPEVGHADAVAALELSEAVRRGIGWAARNARG